MRDKAQIGVVGLQKNEVRQVWSVSGLNLNTPMQLHAQNHRLFVAGRKPGKLSAIKTENGELVTTMDCIETAEDMIFDAKDRRIYVSGSGGLTIIQQQGPDSYSRWNSFLRMQARPRYSSRHSLSSMSFIPRRPRTMPRSKCIR